jgi:hypothetical protein
MLLHDVSVVKGTAGNVAAPAQLRYVLTPAQQELAQWLLRHEGSADSGGPGGPLDSTERVLRRLSPGVTALVTTAGYRALLARALHVTKVRFPFLEGVQLSSGDAFIDGPRVVPGEPNDIGLAEFIGNLIALLATFIGDDLTNRLIRGAWPDAPLERTGPGPGGKP